MSLAMGSGACTLSTQPGGMVWPQLEPRLFVYVDDIANPRRVKIYDPSLVLFCALKRRIGHPVAHGVEIPDLFAIAQLAA